MFGNDLTTRLLPTVSFTRRKLRRRGATKTRLLWFALLVSLTIAGCKSLDFARDETPAEPAATASTECPTLRLATPARFLFHHPASATVAA